MRGTLHNPPSVWDLARQFRINHVHRIPVMEVRGLLRTNEVLCLVSLRPVFMELSRLVQTKCCLSPDLTKLTLEHTRIGKREGIATVSRDQWKASAS